MSRTVFAVFVLVLYVESLTFGKFLNTTRSRSHGREHPSNVNSTTANEGARKSKEILRTTNPPQTETSPQLPSSRYPAAHFNKTWNCSDINLKYAKTNHSNTSVYVYYTDEDSYICNLNPLHCKRPKHPVGGNRNTFNIIPKYGEYTYLPISQWILLLKHGAVAFLYHPCTTKENIIKLQNIAKKCMRRHIITPYEHLNISQPIAMVAWASYYADHHVNETASETWIKNHAMKGPASHILLDGGYTVGLIQPAHLVSDPSDSDLCPKKINTLKNTGQEQDLEMLDKHYNAVHTNGETTKKLKKQLIQHLKNNLRPPKRHVNTRQAAWAVGSLLFLCLILVVVLFYTKPWNERDYYLKEKMVTRNNNSGFSLLKTHLRRGGGGKNTWRHVAEQHRHAAASRRLLGPINEEEEDFMDL